MQLLPAQLDDIPFFIACETNPKNPYIHSWSHEMHKETMEGGDADYFVIEHQGNRHSGYCILRGIQSGNGRIELKRIVIATPGQGLGKQVLSRLIQKAKTEYGAKKIWLEVYDKNPAYALYKQLGFCEEGIPKESELRCGGTGLRIPMSIQL